MALLMTVAEVDKAREELKLQVDTIISFAKEKGRDLTSDETAKCEQLMSSHKSMQADRERAERYEEMQASNVTTQAQQMVTQQLQQTSTPTPPVVPGNDGSQLMTSWGGAAGLQLPQQMQRPVQHHASIPWNAVAAESYHLQALDSVDEALALGMFLRAVAWGENDREATGFCQSHGMKIERDTEGFATMDTDSKLVLASQLGGGYQTMQNIVGDGATPLAPEKGGYLVPTLLAAMILKVVDRWTIARTAGRLFPLAGENVDIPKSTEGDLTVDKPSGTALVSPEYRGDEVTDIAESNPTYSQVNVRAVDAFTLTSISNRLLRENVISAADQVVMDAARAIAKQIDYEYLQADGTAGTPDWNKTGAVPNLGAAGTEVGAVGTAADWSGFTAANLAKVMGLLPDRFYDEPQGGDPRTVWITSRAFYHEVMETVQEGLGGTDKYQAAQLSTRAYRGYPVYFSSWMPQVPAADAVVALFGNFWESVIVGLRQDVSVAMSEHIYFKSDRMAIRVKASWDVQVHRGADLAAPINGSSVDGYTGLAAAAT